MKFDRHELHILNELKAIGLPANKLVNLANAHRIAVTYEISQDKRLTECWIILDGGIRHHGESFARFKEEKISDSVGRMIAFTYAALSFLSHKYPDQFVGLLDTFDAEAIARGSTNRGEVNED